MVFSDWGLKKSTQVTSFVLKNAKGVTPPPCPPPLTVPHEMIKRKVQAKCLYHTLQQQHQDSTFPLAQHLNTRTIFSILENACGLRGTKQKFGTFII